MNLEADVGEESMEEDTEDEDHQATTPDLVREFSDLVEYGDPVETLRDHPYITSSLLGCHQTPPHHLAF